MNNRLKEVRLQQGISQKELAQLLKITPSHLNKIERGKLDPRTSLAVRIAAILDCRVEDIFLS